MLDNPPAAINVSYYCKKNGEEEVVKDWKVEASSTAKNCRNYIREIVDNLHLEPNPEKKVIALSIGDPTVYGNLSPAKETTEAVIKTLLEGTENGYQNTVGSAKAREAIAKYLTNQTVLVEPNDVYLCSGCSSSLELCITALADGTKKQNILMAKPGFPIYRTLAECVGVEVRYYNLIPENNWEIDVKDLESKIDKNTAAIIVNNPSNPCGSVYSAEHLKDVLTVAEKCKVPIIADEIYERLAFPGNDFVSLASLGFKVPMLVCGGLAKRFLVPGWRFGWVVVHDPIGAFKFTREALNRLSQRTLGPNSLIQGALPKILHETPQSFHDHLMQTLIETGKVAFDKITNIKGLVPFKPQGAMYMMVKVEQDYFPQFKNGLDFVSKLMEEESVFCLPGEAFFISGYMRIITTIPADLMEEACIRIGEFCERYYTPK